MSETLPRPIEPQDIEPGMLVRAEHRTGAYAATTEGIVSAVEGDMIWLGVDEADDSRRFLAAALYTWTLLDRPEPEPERPVGSHWRDPKTGAEYVIDVDGDYVLVKGDRNRAPYVIQPRDHRDAHKAALARLVPVPPVFDPRVLWPPARLNDDWCSAADKNSGYGCSRPAGHDGWIHAAYEVHGDRQELGPVLAVWGDPR